MLYLDASVIVAALTDERYSASARSVMTHELDLLASSWTMLESASGLAKKARTEELTAIEFRAALLRLRALEAEHLPILAVADAHFAQAGRFMERAELGLRAGDALHVAITAASASVLVTLDKVLASAAERLGVAVRILA